MKVVFRNIDDIKPYEKNPRKNDDAVPYVAESIKQFGFKVPIIVDRNGIIVAGHTRYKAAKSLNIESVPVIVADDLSDEQIKAFRLADNKVAEKAEWDLDLLGSELDDLIDFDMASLGFDIAEDKPVANNEVAEDEVPEVDEESEPVTKPGDIWILGDHFLMCGDSTSKEDVGRLMTGADGPESCDLVFTDPPYGMKKESDGVLNDNLNYDDLLEFNKKWIPLSFEYLRDMGSWYCWGIDEPLMDIYAHILKPLARKNEIVLRNYITWAKHSAFGMKSALQLSYPRETEKCWFVVKGHSWQNNNAEFFNEKYEHVLEYMIAEAQKVGLTAKRLYELTKVHMWGHWFSKSQFTVIPKKHYEILQAEYNKHGAFLMSHEELRDMIGIVNSGKRPEKPYFDCTWFDDGDIPLTDVWRNAITSNKERESTGGHATPKPLKICERAIVTSSREGDIVLDLFGGSGSTLIACEQLSRRCRMMELDPRYCDVIIKRWETITGKKAVLVTAS